MRIGISSSRFALRGSGGLGLSLAQPENDTHYMLVLNGFMLVFDGMVLVLEK